MSLSTTLQVMPRINQGTIIICIIRNLMSSSRILHIFFLSVLPSVETDSMTDISASILLLPVLQISRDSSRAASAPPGNLSNKKKEPHNHTTAFSSSSSSSSSSLPSWQDRCGIPGGDSFFLTMIKTFCNWQPLASRIVGKSICCRSVAVEFCTVLKDYWKTDGLPTWNSSGMEQVHILPNLLHDFSALDLCMASVLFSSLSTLTAATCKKIAQQEMLQKFINLVLQNIWSQNDKKKRISVWPNLHFAQAHQIGMMV